MKFILLLLSVLCLFTVAAQQNLSQLYPVLQKLDLPRGKAFIKDTIGCLVGDCKEGEGVYGSVSARWLNTLTDIPKVDYVLYKGKFSNNGNLFNGKMYRLQLSYKKEGDYQSGFVLTPHPDSASALEDKLLKSGLLYDGEALAYLNKYDKKPEGYTPHGRGSDAMLLANRSDIQHFTGLYINGLLYYADITFKQDSDAASFKGYVRMNSDFMAGTIKYRDGDTYRGFFINNTPTGPGTMMNSAGKATTGRWLNGSLLEARSFNITEQMFTPDTVNKQSITFSVLNQQHRGTLVAEADSNQLIWSANRLFFGRLVDGKAQGYSFYSYLDNTQSYFNPTLNTYRRREYVFEGEFDQGLLNNGSRTDHEYIARLAKQQEYLLVPGNWSTLSSSTAAGKFENNYPSGCVQTFKPGTTSYTSIKLSNGQYQKGWIGQYNSQGKMVAANYVYRQGADWPFLHNKNDLSEEDIAAALKDETTCVAIPEALKKSYAENMKIVMERKREQAILDEKYRQIMAQQKRQADSIRAAPLAQANKDCDTRKKNLRSDWMIDNALILDYDCSTNKYVLGKRVKAIMFDNKYQPHHYTEIFLMEPAVYDRTLKQGNSYKLCPACNGYPVSSAEYLSTKQVWKPVLGLVWYVRGKQTEIVKSINVCKTCRGEAWVRK